MKIKFLNSYEIVENLGAGPVAMVYKCKCLGDERPPLILFWHHAHLQICETTTLLHHISNPHIKITTALNQPIHLNFQVNLDSLNPFPLDPKTLSLTRHTSPIPNSISDFGTKTTKIIKEQMNEPNPLH